MVMQKQFNITLVYHNPEPTVLSFDHIQEVVRSTFIQKKAVSILDDFTDDFLSDGINLSYIIEYNRLTKIIDKPTRIASTLVTLFILIISGRPNTIISHAAAPHNIADHDRFMATQRINKHKHATVTRAYRHLGKYSCDALCCLLLQQDMVL